jgi:hypothetical protein
VLFGTVGTELVVGVVIVGVVGVVVAFLGGLGLRVVVVMAVVLVVTVDVVVVVGVVVSAPADVGGAVGETGCVVTATTEDDRPVRRARELGGVAAPDVGTSIVATVSSTVGSRVGFTRSTSEVLRGAVVEPKGT